VLPSVVLVLQHDTFGPSVGLSGTRYGGPYGASQEPLHPVLDPAERQTVWRATRAAVGNGVQFSTAGGRKPHAVFQYGAEH
jgi:hypothetical protein